jgi:hypothetical protein
MWFRADRARTCAQTPRSDQSVVSSGSAGSDRRDVRGRWSRMRARVVRGGERMWASERRFVGVRAGALREGDRGRLAGAGRGRFSRRPSRRLSGGCSGARRVPADAESWAWSAGVSCTSLLERRVFLNTSGDTSGGGLPSDAVGYLRQPTPLLRGGRCCDPRTRSGATAQAPAAGRNRSNVDDAARLPHRPGSAPARDAPRTTC